MSTSRYHEDSITLKRAHIYCAEDGSDSDGFDGFDGFDGSDGSDGF